jgi:hypothetical protein
MKTTLSFVPMLTLVGVLALVTPTLTHAQTFSSPVRSVDNPARQPVDIFLNLNFGFNDIEASAFFTAPSGKRLVIEHVSLRATFGQPHKAYGNIVTQRQGSQFHFFKIDLIGPIGSAGQQMIASDLIKIYVDPNTALRVDVTRDTSGNVGQGSVHLSGHYVDLP